MAKTEVPGEAYWSDIARYSRIIESRLAYTTGRIILGIGRRMHTAAWDAATEAGPANWYRPEVRCLGLPIDERAVTLRVSHDAAANFLTAYLYKPEAADLTVLHTSMTLKPMASTLQAIDEILQDIPGKGIREPDYVKLHQELAYGASISAP